MTSKISSPRVRVTVENGDELTEYTVQTDNRDMVRWDRHRAQQKWPTAQEAPFLWMTFLSWAALSRGGHTDERYADYEQRCLAVVSVDKDGNEMKVNPETGQLEDGGIAADPTQ